MIYRTYYRPFLLPLASASLSSSHPHPASSSPLLSYSSLSQVVERGMERVEGPLKSSFRLDMALKTAPYTNHHHHQQQKKAFFDDLSAVNGQNAVMGDDFFVDDLLDFSNAVADDPEEQNQQEALENDDTTAAKSVSNVTSATFSVKDDDFGSLPASELSVLADDLESLEWLSHFVDDSFSEYSLTYPATKLPPEPAKVKPEPEVPVQTKPCFTTPAQTKARSKRTRAGVHGWSLGSSSLSESSSSSSSSYSSTTTSSSPCNPWLVYSSLSQTQTAESFDGKPQLKKQKKKPAMESSGGGGQAQPRRCSHCGVQKTPQWRAGPLGAKTLCNACGVRHKSGRLLPEYRPACSPTFSSELHSNNHRKVLEMRRKKDMEAGLAPPVQSF